MKNKLVLGTVQFGLDYGINNTQGKPSLKTVQEILDFAFANGIQELDTADAYGNSAEVLKEYFHSSQNRFEVMSKFIADPDISFEQAFNESLKRLGLSKLKGYYFHRFSDFVSFNEFSTVHALKETGHLKSLAVSLYGDDELAKAATHPEVDLIQLPFNIFDSSKQKVELMKKAKENGKQIYVRSVFLQGLFFMDPARLPAKLAPLSSSLQELQKISQDFGVGMQELCLNFVLGKAYVDKVVIGVDTQEQLNENISLIKGALPAELEKRIESIVISTPELLNPSQWK